MKTFWKEGLLFWENF